MDQIRLPVRNKIALAIQSHILQLFLQRIEILNDFVRKSFLRCSLYFVEEEKDVTRGGIEMKPYYDDKTGVIDNFLNPDSRTVNLISQQYKQ